MTDGGWGYVIYANGAVADSHIRVAETIEEFEKFETTEQCYEQASEFARRHTLPFALIYPPDPNLPRGTRIKVGTRASLKEVMVGPAHVDDGSQNLSGAIRACMGVCGARSIREFQDVEMVIAPAIVSEGKQAQTAQRVGMGSKT